MTSSRLECEATSRHRRPCGAPAVVVRRGIARCAVHGEIRPGPIPPHAIDTRGQGLLFDHSRDADRAPPAGFVYFIRSGDRVKIGFTTHDPRERLRELQTGNPTRLELLGAAWASMHAEQQLHRRYAAQRVGGEWFDLTDAHVTEAMGELL